jgi:hypothetical protein
VSPVKYGQGSYIPEDGIPHSNSRKSLKCYSEPIFSFPGRDHLPRVCIKEEKLMKFVVLSVVVKRSSIFL